MENQFIVGNIYTKEEIENSGFNNTRLTSIVVFYRKDKTLMSFDKPKPLKPNAYKLLAIQAD